jgi:tRNA(Ile2) C34 agmatinyltransferase TiaS
MFKDTLLSSLLQKSAAEVDVEAGRKCPECGSTDTESNGSTEYRCVECDHRWGTDCGEQYGF